MKRWIALCLALWILAALPACGRKPDKSLETGASRESSLGDDLKNALDVSPEDGQKADGETTTVSTVPNGGDGDIPTPYADRIDWFRSLARYPEGAGADCLGYVIQDFSGDGVPELGIGQITQYGSHSLCALYTLRDGKLRTLFEAERADYTYMGGSDFRFLGSDGAWNGQGGYHLTQDGQFVCDWFLFTADWETFYENDTGSWDIQASRRADASAESFSFMAESVSMGCVDLPLIPFGDAAENQVPPVDVRWLADAETDYTVITLAEGEPQARLLFTACRPLGSFTVLSLSLTNFGEDGTMRFDATPLMSADLSPEEPLAVGLVIPGDLPAYGIAYHEPGVGTRRFAITVSGEDGSLCLIEANPYEEAFVLPAEAE